MAGGGPGRDQIIEISLVLIAYLMAHGDNHVSGLQKTFMKVARQGMPEPNQVASQEAR